jgi:hypothetical protein
MRPAPVGITQPLIRFVDFSAAGDSPNSSVCFNFEFGTRFGVA